jgi:hypothetical protein
VRTIHRLFYIAVIAVLASPLFPALLLAGESLRRGAD